MRYRRMRSKAGVADPGGLRWIVSQIAVSISR